MKLFEKIFGWLLISLGVAVMLYSLYSSFNVFTGVNPPPEIFKEIEKETALPQKGKTLDLQAQIEKTLGEQLKGIIPVNSLIKLLNLVAWSLFAGILIFGGAQLTNLGIKLVKPYAK